MTNIANKLPSAARLLLGLTFFVFGLNGFLHFIPQPPMVGPAADFSTALFMTGYMFPLLKATEVIAGLLLLLNRYVPLALALLAPVLVNIVGFHAFLAPAGLGLPVVLLALELFLVRSYWGAFTPMLQARVDPRRNAEHAERPRVTAPAS